MHFDVLDQYRAAESPVHQLDARVKLLCTLAFILACALTPDGAWLAFGALAVLWLATALLSDVPLALLLRRGLVALPFALAAVTVLFTLPGEPLLVIPLGRWELTISDAGLVRFLTIMLKSWLSVLMALLLSATTTFPDILRAMRDLHVPNVLVGVIAFMYRYIFVLADEALRLLRAREARMAIGPAGRHSGGSIAWRAKIVGGMAGNLFVRSFTRSERVYQAMASRGYAGELRWLSRPRLERWHIAWGALFLTVLLLIEILARLMGTGLSR
jgi:cobalt/nickel transport system permease protein